MKTKLCIRSLSILSGLIISMSTFSQAPDWSRLLQLHTYGNQLCNYVTADQNFIYMAASISGSVTFGGTDFSSVGLRDMVIVKMNSSGECTWTRQINALSGGTIYADAMKTDASGNIYATGIFTGESTIGSSTITSGTSASAFIAKFDADGNGLWATAFSYIGSGRSRIAIDGSGNVFLISRGNKLLKFSNSGEFQWEQTYPANTLLAIAVNGTDLFIGGALPGGTTDFGSIPLTSLGGYYTGYLVRADLDGVYNSSMIVGGSTTGDGSSVSDIQVNNAGDLIITGVYTMNLELGTINISNPEQAYYTYIAECDNNFTFSWASSSGSYTNPSRNMINNRLFIDNLNNIYQYGNGSSSSFLYGSVDVMPVSGMFLVKFDQDGNPTSSLLPPSTALGNIYVTPGGDVISGASITLSGDGSYGNFYVAKYNASTLMEWQEYSSNSMSGTVSIRYIKHDKEGNTIIQARAGGYCNYFGTVLNTPGNVTVISKHDIAGNMLWMRQINDMNLQLFGSSFMLDKDDNVITSGLFNGSLNIENVTLNTSNSGYEAYVAKYSSTGEFMWASALNLGMDVTDDITIDTDHDGNILVSGTVNPANFLVKFNANGNKLWAKSFPMESYYFSLVSTDANNNIYLTSEIHLHNAGGSTTIGGVILTQTNDDGAIALIKFDPDGNALWARTYGGVSGASYSDGWATDIETDASGNSYLWGWCRNNSQFGTITLTNPLPDNHDYSYCLVKINTSGDVVWAKAVYEVLYGFNYGDLLDLDPLGNIYVGGHFRSLISIDGNEFTPTGTYDFFAAKFSNAGSFQWLVEIPSNSIIINALCTNDEDVLSIAGIPGINPALGTFPIDRLGGSNAIAATLGNLHPAYHFMPAWYPGNGTDHMNLYALSATLDGADLQPGDEIGVFDGDICVGSGVLSTVLTESNFLPIEVSKDDPETTFIDGYTTGNPISYKVWNSADREETENVQAYYISGEGIFVPGETAYFNLSAIFSETQVINLDAGWNVFSAAVVPDNMSMLDIVDPLIVPDVLIKVQDEEGKAVERLSVGWINEIGDMSVTEGYKIRVTEGTSLNITGTLVTLPLDIPLETGWNIIGYPSLNQQSSASAFETLIASEALVKVQNERGQAIEQIEENWFYGFANLIPGEGYKVRTNADVTLTITGGAKGETLTEERVKRETEYFRPEYTGNGLDHMNIYVGRGEWEKGRIGEGDEIGVFDGDVCVGAVVVEEGKGKYIHLTASFDDPETQEIDGFREGNTMELRIWDREKGEEVKVEVEVKQGYGDVFERQGTTVLGAKLKGERRSSLGDAYPNPSAERTTFNFRIAEECRVRLEVYDVTGNRVTILVDEMMPEGHYEREWDNRTVSGSKVKPGFYFYRLKLNDITQIKQLVIK